MNLHFLRPEWFLAFIPLLALAVWGWRRHASGGAWSKIVDAQLLEHLIGQHAQSQRRHWWWLGLLLATLIIIALAGPAWRKLPQPVFKQESALVIALDLSQSMNAEDFRPSRLARARLKLIDLLKMRREGQTGLIVYAADAFTVSPLTDDSATVQSLVSSLDSSIMPAQGSRADLAVTRAIDLLRNAGRSRGDILLISDGLSTTETSQLLPLVSADYRVSILAVGSADGAPIPAPGDGGGFVKDSQGSIVIARTDHPRLRELARRLGGVYQRMSLDDSDISGLQALFDQQDLKTEHRRTDFNADRWMEEGPWLLLLVLPLAALLFRRGVLLSGVVALLLAQPDPALAESGWDWSQLWLNNDQRAQRQLAAGDNEEAAAQFNNSDWKAAAQYRAGQYEQALQQWQSRNDPEALYNRGNALARMGRLEEALASYDELLKQQPGHEDASANRELVEQALRQQQQQQQQQDGQQQGEDGQQQPGEQGQSQNESQQSGEPDQQQQQQQQQQQPGEDSSAGQSQSAEAAQSGEDDAQESASSGDEAEMKQNESANSESQSQQQDAEQTPAEQAATKPSPEQQDESAENSAAGQMASTSEDLSHQAEEQWLRRVPDDPGGLLRNKFRYQYSRQAGQNREEQQW